MQEQFNVQALMQVNLTDKNEQKLQKYYKIKETFFWK